MTTPNTLRRRTREERDEINERARMRSRPLTSPQIAALKLLGDGPLIVTPAGWRGLRTSESVLTQTLVSLETRGLLTFMHRGKIRRRTVARVTPKGRDTFRRYA